MQNTLIPSQHPQKSEIIPKSTQKSKVQNSFKLSFKSDLGETQGIINSEANRSLAVDLKSQTSYGVQNCNGGIDIG